MSLLMPRNTELKAFLIIGMLASCTSPTEIDVDGIRESLVEHLGLLSSPNMEKVSCNLQNKLLIIFKS